MIVTAVPKRYLENVFFRVIEGNSSSCAFRVGRRNHVQVVERNRGRSNFAVAIVFRVIPIEEIYLTFD